MGCVFSTSHQWVALEHIAKERVERFAAAEQEIHHTIDVKLTVMEKVAKGAMEKVLPMDDPMLPRWIEMSLSKTFTVENLLMKDWIRPLGAFVDVMEDHHKYRIRYCCRHRLGPHWFFLSRWNPRRLPKDKPLPLIDFMNPYSLTLYGNIPPEAHRPFFCL